MSSYTILCIPEGTILLIRVDSAPLYARDLISRVKEFASNLNADNDAFVFDSQLGELYIVGNQTGPSTSGKKPTMLPEAFKLADTWKKSVGGTIDVALIRATISDGQVNPVNGHSVNVARVNTGAAFQLTDRVLMDDLHPQSRG